MDNNQSAESELSNNDLFKKLIVAISEASKNTKEEVANEIKSESKKIIEKLEEQNRKITELENKNTILENRCIQLERQCRKNNIIIFGLKVPEGINLLEYILNKFAELLQVELSESDISNIHTLKSDKSTPIKVEFVSFLKKGVIFQNVKKLKGKGIFIAHDLCHEDQRDNKILQRHFKLARLKNNLVKIRGNKLIVNGDVYTANQLKEIEIDETSSPTQESNVNPFE